MESGYDREHSSDLHHFAKGFTPQCHQVWPFKSRVLIVAASRSEMPSFSRFQQDFQ
jgi:hypothetical protein